MNFHRNNALSFSIENILRDDFPRRQRPDVFDAQTQTSFENVPTTVVGHRCAFCRQLLPNTNAVSLHHSADETIQHRNVQGSMNPQSSRAANEDQSRHFNTANGLGVNASENLHAPPIQCTDHEQPQMRAGRTYMGLGTDVVTGIQYKIERMYLELVPDYEEH